MLSGHQNGIAPAALITISHPKETDWTRRLLFREERQQIKKSLELPVIIGLSTEMKRIEMFVRRAAASQTVILIEGETGTGKGLLAETIHLLSSRREKPFVYVNCGAIPENLVESELFGYEAGAFTDARKSKLGKFEAAKGGSIFLDEIEDLPYKAQSKLLRVLDNNTISRLGELGERFVDVRIIAATNQNLRNLVAKKVFRDDLYYRLAVVPILIPPLRERREDILPTFRYFLDKLAHVYNDGHPLPTSEKWLCSIMERRWEGNVRELQHVVEQAYILREEPKLLPESADLSRYQADDFGTPQPVCLPDSKNGSPILTLRTAEMHHIQQALIATHGNRTKAAALLGISTRTIRNKLKQIA